MEYLAVLGREPNISLSELEAIFSDVKQFSPTLASFKSTSTPDLSRLGGSLKIAVKLDTTPLDYLSQLPEGKITFGISDYTSHASVKSAMTEALKLKKILVRHGRSVRTVANKHAELSTAISLHNGLASSSPNKTEFIKTNHSWYRVIAVQDINSYAKRDRNRPARDAKVGMLPPKLAQILINLCGDLPTGSRILDPFCGTGVVLQEALLMGYSAYGTDIDERMIEYTNKNLTWLQTISRDHLPPFTTQVGDVTTHNWDTPIDAVACECYLGRPMSLVPLEIKLKEEKQTVSSIILGFLKNLSSQLAPGTPVTIAIPAWLRKDGQYSRLNILDEIANLGYNVNNKSREGLLYHREGQIVARDIIILRKI